MIIRRTDKGSHYYMKDGSPFYLTPKKDGSGMRPVKVTDAFKVGAYRSVTNILGILDKPGLDIWKAEQTIISAMSLPRYPLENDQDFAERVIIDAEVQSRKAAEAGTRLHELASSWLIFGTLPAPASESILLEPFQAWCRSTLHPETGLLGSETVVLNHTHGYAGRIDLAVRMADGSIALLDIKTQEVKNSKPSYYDEYALQLAAYSRCIFADGSYPPPFPWRLISIIISRSEPGCWTHEWTDAAHPHESSEPHFQAFLSAAKVWSYFKGGTPGIDAKKAA